MIPKKIHYFWFGRGQKSPLEIECISRFAEFAPGFEIVQWDEDSFDVEAHPYSARAYKDKKWAFVSDYARLKVLHDEGGIYLDTDMFLLKSLTSLLEHTAFIGKEDSVHISAGIIGAEAKNDFIKDVLKYYDNVDGYITIPRVLTEVYSNKVYDIKVFESEVFYPFASTNIKYFNKEKPPKGAFAVHMWNYSWGHPVVKIFKKLGLHRKAIYITEKLRIKKTLKKILGAQ